LEEWWGILQPKIDDMRYVCPKHGLKGSFRLILFLYLMVLIPPMDVKLCEDLLSIQLLQLSSDVREWAVVAHDPLIEFLIIHDYSALL
jgi:hypothetical protein